MGLLTSLRRRLRLIKGEPPSAALRIIFASRSYRRTVELKKLPTSATPPGMSAKTWLERSILDHDWYAQTHVLKGSEEAYAHFRDVGLSRAHAPSPDFAGPDGIHLSHWGIECLFRAGLEFGSRGAELLLPGDRRGQDPCRLDNPRRKSVAVVTAIFGGFDRLLPVDPAWDKTTDFFLFSDRVFENAGLWQLVHNTYDHPDPRRRARFVKTHLPTYFASYDWVVWVDGNVLICTDPVEALAPAVGNDLYFATFRHPDRNTLIAEAAACIRFRKDDPALIGRHLAQNMGRSGMGEELLFETMVCVMRPGLPQVHSMCAAWWDAMAKGSVRDQLSLPLAVHQVLELRYGFLPGSIQNSRHFAKIGHAA